MCGRLLLNIMPEDVECWLHFDPGRIFEPRYNFAPTQWLPAIRTQPAARRREIVPLRWGFVPLWATELAIGNKMINARSETVFEKSSFRNAIRRKRCIVPATGFYEWRRKSKDRQPHLFTLKSGRPLALAGLWEYNGAVPEGPVETFTILTTTANDLIRPLHDRMPVILPEESIDRWLGPESEGIKDLLRPLPSDAIAMRPVSSHVNNPANEGPACIAPPQLAEPSAAFTTKSGGRKRKTEEGQGLLLE